MNAIQAGGAIENIVLATDPVRVLRFGATTHNAHRIHYDAVHAASDGLERPVVMAQLQGTLFHRAAARAAGQGGTVTALSWQNRAPAYVGETLTVSGRVIDVQDGVAHLELEEHTEDGRLCATGSAVVRLP